VHEKFLEKLKSLAEDRVVGDPFDEKTTNGALISQVQFQRVLDYIKSGNEEVNTFGENEFLSLFYYFN